MSPDLPPLVQAIMPGPPLTITFSQSRTEKDQKCQRARYYATEFHGTGIEPRRKAYELDYGSILHAGLHELLQGRAVDLVLQSADEQLAMVFENPDDLIAKEQRTLLAAHLLGAHEVVFPAILSTDDIVTTEAWSTYTYRLLPNDPVQLRLRARTDLVTRRRSDGLHTYREFKSTKYTDANWFESWKTSVQLMSGCRAVSATIREPVTQAIIHAFYKGYSHKTYGYNCPLVYGWRNVGGVTSQYRGTRPQAYKGWEKFPVWEIGVENWIRQDMPRPDLLSCFPQSEPIYVDDLLVDAWFRQRGLRERTIWESQRVLQGLSPTMIRTNDVALQELDTVFPQTFNQCKPMFGKGCEFFDVCWLPHIELDPIGSGLYQARVPVETEGLDGEQDGV